ncbi:type II secretion system protein N [Cognaticolwellia mytili]|uniref:type II secretion system protein N n=1 Tax=Cognaticolwellia mytili TaxID=1888913 RepID=UPI000A172D27|nr:type II secretion system protein N [Cognaticolwellia mytili]
MKKNFTIAAIFIVLYSVFVIALMPANWLAGQIKLPNNVTVAGIEGSIWQTKISQVIVDDIIISQVESSLSLLSVLMLDPKFDITFGDALINGPEGHLVLSGLLTDITIEDAMVGLAANNVSAKLNLPIDIIAHEQLTINVARFVIGAPICSELDGDFHWRNAAVTALDEKIKLGKLSAKLSCDEGELIADIDPKNNLGLSYRAQIKKSGRFSGSGYLTPGAKFPEELKSALNFIGKADKKGRYRLKI